MIPPTVSLATQAAIDKAESRSSILHELSKAYGKRTTDEVDESESKITSSLIDVSINLDSLSNKGGGSNPGYCDVIQRFISDRREKTKRFLSDSLFGKSIVVSNANKPTLNSKRYDLIKSTVLS